MISTTQSHGPGCILHAMHLGALLLEQGHYEEAEALYRADLGLNKTVCRCAKPEQYLVTTRLGQMSEPPPGNNRTYSHETQSH